jgi:hypothetical protein
LYIAGVGRALGTCEDDVMQVLSHYGTVQHLLMEADKVLNQLPLACSTFYTQPTSTHTAYFYDALTGRPIASRATKPLRKL